MFVFVGLFLLCQSRPVEDCFAESGKPVKRIDTFNGVAMAYLTNFALPRAGEVARCGVVFQRSGLGFDRVLGTVILERTFDMVCLLIITILVALLRIDIFAVMVITRIWDPFY